MADAGKGIKVAKRSKLPDGGMMHVEVGEKDVLLIRIGDEVIALGRECPHYGAPLEKGLLHDGRLICPWHQAVFDARNGDLVHPPSLDGLTRFEVRIKGDDIFVTAPADVSEKRTMPMCSCEKNKDARTFVIVGAGAAGSAAAEALRQEGFWGRIVMIGPEDRLPYDRTNCSKGYLSGNAPAEYMPLRSAEFYRKFDIERLKARAISVDIASRKIEFEDADTIRADAILLATGAAPRKPDVPGVHLENVFTLRSWDDCDRILEALKSAFKAVVVGASFIGMEVAAALRERKMEVTVVGPEKIPFEKILGPEVGDLLRKRHEENGTAFKLGTKPKRFTGNGKVSGVELEDGSTLECDLVVIGVGVEPVTDYVRGVPLEKDKSLKVDETLKVADGVYAAGDIARFPNPYLGESVRIEHWALAQQQGRTAARNLLGKGEPFSAVPFFWTRHFGKSLACVGHAPAWDEILMTGNPEDFAFTALYARNGKLLAAAGTQSEETMAFHELMRIGKLPSPEEIRGKHPAGLQKRLRD